MVDTLFERLRSPIASMATALFIAIVVITSTTAALCSRRGFQGYKNPSTRTRTRHVCLIIACINQYVYRHRKRVFLEAASHNSLHYKGGFYNSDTFFNINSLKPSVKPPHSLPERALLSKFLPRNSQIHPHCEPMRSARI